MAEQNQNVQETTQDGRVTKKWSKGKKVAVWSGVGVAVAGLVTGAIFLIRKFKKA
jgi:hypothetical protein